MRRGSAHPSCVMGMEGACSTGSGKEFAAGIPGGEDSADSQEAERLQLQLYLPCTPFPEPQPRHFGISRNSVHQRALSDKTTSLQVQSKAEILCFTGKTNTQLLPSPSYSAICSLSPGAKWKIQQEAEPSAGKSPECENIRI